MAELFTIPLSEQVSLNGEYLEIVTFDSKYKKLIMIFFHCPWPENKYMS